MNNNYGQYPPNQGRPPYNRNNDAMLNECMASAFPPKTGQEVIDINIPEVQECKNRLGCLCWGKVLYIFLAVIAAGPMMGISEMFMLWMIYQAYARLHWCQTGILVLFFGIAAL